jgi:hypothetical protein
LLFLVQLVDEVQHLFSGRDVAHGIAVVHEAHDALLVNESLGGHTAEFEDLDLLAVALEHDVLGVGQAGEWQVVLGEIIGELLGVIRADDEDGRVAFAKLLIVLAQLRHVRAAEWSLEAAVEY